MKKTIVAILFIALLAFAPHALADGYLGFGIGQSSVDIDLGPQAPGITATVDDTGTAYKMFGGNKITDNFGWELGWIDFGDYNIYLTDGIDYINQDVTGTAFFLAAVGYLPLSESVDLLGKVGLHRWDVDFKSDSSLGFIPDESDSGTDFMFGIGLQLSDVVRVEYERYTNIGDPDGEDIDVITGAYILMF